MIKMRLLLPLGIFILTSTFLVAAPATSNTVNLHPWEALAIQDSGRRKPMGIFGHEMLVKLSGRDPVTTKDGAKVGGTDFAFSMLFATHDWADEPIILLSYHPLTAQLGLEATRKRFSPRELEPVAAQLESLSREAAALRQSNQPIPRLHSEAQTVAGRLQMFHALSDSSAFLLIPPPAGAPHANTWLSLTAFGSVPSAQGTAILQGLRDLGIAFREDDNAKFAATAVTLKSNLRALNPGIYPSDKVIERELFYQRLKPFDAAIWLFAVAFILLAIGTSKGLRRLLTTAGLTCTVVGFAIMVYGILLRVIIAGRAPVTNMYESVVWVSMAIVLFGIIFYAVYRNRTILLSALPISLLCLLLVRNLPVAMPSRLDPLVPVLRDNFWLTAHVLTITLSYAAFALTLGFSHVVLWQYIRRPKEAPNLRQLHEWLYRMMFVGLILLAAGTVLGGVWANYSWGRFWGWDPKETWALIALLMYVLAMHGKMAGWWGNFGIAVAGIVNFSGIVMAWYGVNYVLGTGLHSYGFGVGGEGYVIAFLALEAAYVSLAIVRHHRAPKLTPAEA